MARHADPTAKISLLRAAEEVFAEAGISSAKIEEITNRAGLSKGSFYLHFASKEEAFKQVVESFLARFESLYPPPGSGDRKKELPETAAGMVAYWLERDGQIFDFLWQNRAIVAILAGCQGPYTYLTEAFRARVERTCLEWVQVLQARHLLRRELDAPIAATMICGAYHELSHRMLTMKKKPPIETWMRQAMSILLGGIGSKEMVSAAGAAARLTNPLVNDETRRQRSSLSTKRAQTRKRATTRGIHG